MLEALRLIAVQDYDSPGSDVVAFSPDYPESNLYVQAFAIKSSSHIGYSRDLAWGVYLAIKDLGSLHPPIEKAWHCFVNTKVVSYGSIMSVSSSSANSANSMPQGPSINEVKVPDSGLDYKIRFQLVWEGSTPIPPKTVYEGVAYAILWIAQLDARDTPTHDHVIMVPGSNLVFAYVGEPERIRWYDAGYLTKLIATRCERYHRFQAVAFDIYDESGQRSIASISMSNTESSRLSKANISDADF